LKAEPHLAAIVDLYIERHRQRARNELAFYVGQPNLSAAIHKAARAVNQDGKRADHQRRIRAAVLVSSDTALQSISHELEKLSTFEELHERIERAIGSMKGVGPLLVYDTAHRIGAHLKLEPRLVYLHAGTRVGARTLGLRGKTLEVSKLPTELQKLTAAELEDCLCIFKDRLGPTAAGFNTELAKGCLRGRAHRIGC
jgi:hypothetical protein